MLCLQHGADLLPETHTTRGSLHLLSRQQVPGDALVEHLNLKPEAHVGILPRVRLPHHIIGAPYVVGQVERHSLGHVRLGVDIGEGIWYSRAHQGTIQRPAQASHTLNEVLRPINTNTSLGVMQC